MTVLEAAAEFESDAARYSENPRMDSVWRMAAAALRLYVAAKLQRGAAEAYEAHVDGCRSCQVYEPCSRGGRLRKAYELACGAVDAALAEAVKSERALLKAKE